SAELAAAFQPGDHLIVVQTTGDLLHIPRSVADLAAEAVTRAVDAFHVMDSLPDDAITAFYRAFADRLRDDDAWSQIAAANETDVASAKARGRATTRLSVSDRMRAEMIAGLSYWASMPSPRNRVVETIEHDGWRVDLAQAGLGVVGFVFEGRPNVFADATGVLRSGNTVVLRIGGDALGTAQAILELAVQPALREAGLPDGAVSLVASADRAAGWAMFNDSRLSLAIARGSGPAVEQLGAVARQAGVPVSLHGTGGAWLVAAMDTDPDRFRLATLNSLDRKACNTLNVCCIPRGRRDLVAVFLEALRAAGDRHGFGFKLHVTRGSEDAVPTAWFAASTVVRRATGDSIEPLAETIAED
ncbi:MAG: aldehyde dehydrogenase family protein, partial [Dehalococcoidia bacterium]|nr:aldehyde dehydrogenase family protein [Dehalococcoidia bacterium]